MHLTVSKKTALFSSRFLALPLLALCGNSHAALPALDPTQPHTINDGGYNMPWATLTLPAGWGYNGGMVHANNCAIMGPSALFSGESADHRFGFVVLPSLKTTWSSDEAFNAQMRTAGCPLVNSVTADGFLRSVALTRLSPPGAVVVATGPLPELAPLVQKVRAMNEQLMRNAMNGPNIRTRYVVDSAKIRVAYDKDGRHMNADLVAVTNCMDQTTTFPVLNRSTRFYDCTAIVLASSFAPAQDMDAFAKITTFKLDINPAWTARNNQVQQQIAQQRMANQQGQFDANQRAHAAQMNGYEQYNKAQQQRSNAVHESNQAFAAHMGDYNDYTDPTTGQSVRGSNQYNNTYQSSDGSTVLQTNQAGSPGVDWSLMVPRFK